MPLSSTLTTFHETDCIWKLLLFKIQMENKQNILRLILSYKQCLILEYYTLRGLKCVFYTINEIKDWEGGIKTSSLTYI